jgi:parallel beta-helix repeat protein
MNDKKLTQLTELTEVADDDYLYITDTSASASRKAQAKNVRGWPKTAAETSAGVSIVSYQYPPGDVLRYGTNTTPGTTDMTTVIQNALDSNKEVLVPAGDYLITTQLTMNADNVLRGEGWDSNITMSGADKRIVHVTGVDRVTVRDIKLTNVLSTTNVPTVNISNSADSRVLNCYITGCSGDGVRGVSGTVRLLVDGCYFAGGTGSVQDQSDIAFFLDCKYSIASNNQCHLGGWHGIRCQHDSFYNTVIGNTIGTHTAYGIIITYEDVTNGTPGPTYNKAIGNTIYDITGAALISGEERAGAGIYGVAGGNCVIEGNIIKDCNQLTDIEVLAPAGIGINDMRGDTVIANNHIVSCDWYGIVVFSTDEAQTAISGNTVQDCTKTGIYTKNSNYVNINGNTVWNDTAAAAAIAIRGESATSYELSVTNNHIYGDGTNGVTRGINALDVEDVVISGNKIKHPSTYGIYCDSVDNAAITGNTVVDSDDYCVRLISSTNVTVTGNVLEGTGTYAFNVATSCSGSQAHSNVMSPNLVYNAVSGCKLTTTGSATPVGGYYQVGDIVMDTAPTAGGTIGWVCTTAGTSPTWKTFGSIEVA